MPYIHRTLEKQVRFYLDHFPVVSITGPRQSGKSTMLKKILKNYQYITFDDDTIANDFYSDHKKKGRFVITSSTQFTLLKQISESLAGRVGLLSLLPFQYKEMPKKYRSKSIYAGCYPETVLTNFSINQQWYSTYITTYLERDVRGLHNIGDLRDFRRLISLLAANASQILNMSKLASNEGYLIYNGESLPKSKNKIDILNYSDYLEKE